MLGAGQLRLGRLGEVRQPFDGGHTGAPFQPGRERLAQHPGAGGLGDPGGGGQPGVSGGVAADQDDRRLTGTQ